MTFLRSSLEAILRNACIKSKPWAVTTLSRMSTGTEISDAGLGKLTTFEPLPSFLETSFLETMSYFQRMDQQVKTRADRKKRDVLGRRVDDTPSLASELDETMATYVPSTASREISGTIEPAGAEWRLNGNK
jgi:hypothetical protein